MEVCDDLERHDAIVEETPIRVSEGDRPGELLVFRRSWERSPDFDARQVVGVRRIRKEGHRTGSASSPGADVGELDGRPTPDVKFAACGVDDRELAFPVGEDVDRGTAVGRISTHHEAPGLGVVH
jgi:hypothetical protein